MGRPRKSGTGYFGDAVLPQRAGARLDPERRKDALIALLWVNQRLAEIGEGDLFSARRVEALTRERARLETALGTTGRALV